MSATARHGLPRPATDCHLPLNAKTFGDLPIVLDVPQAAALAGVSERTLWRWLADGRLKANRAPRSARIRIRRDDVLALQGLIPATAAVSPRR